MGCNCKSKVNKKYTDGKDNGRENRSKSGVLFYKILNILFYLLVVVFAILLVPLAIVFVVGKKFSGKEAKINLPFADKIKNIRKDG